MRLHRLTIISTAFSWTEWEQNMRKGERERDTSEWRVEWNYSNASDSGHAERLAVEIPICRIER